MLACSTRFDLCKRSEESVTRRRSPSMQLDRSQSIFRHGLNNFRCMNQRKADPRLVWLASVLAAATLVIFLAHQA